MQKTKKLIEGPNPSAIIKRNKYKDIKLKKEIKLSLFEDGMTVYIGKSTIDKQFEFK